MPKQRFVQEQLDIINSKDDCLFVCGGRQSGKSFALVWHMAKNCVEQPGSNVLYTCKSDIQAKDMYQRLIDNPLVKRGMRKCHASPHHEIWFENGSHIICNSTREPRGLKGPTYDLVILDEIQDSLSRADYEDVVPALTLAKQGREIFAGQPRTPHHWFFSKYIAGIPKGVLDPYSQRVGLGLAGHRTIVFPTPRGLPYQTPKGKIKLAQLQAGLSQEFRWDRDYLCMWTSETDSKAFCEADVMRCVRGTTKPFISGHKYVVSVDLGWRKDNAVMICFDVTVMAVVWMRVYRHLHPDKLIEQITDLRMRYGGTRNTFVIDATGGGNPGQPIDYAKRIRARMPNVHFEYFTPQGKPDMVIRLKSEIEHHSFSIPEEYQELIDELCLYECEVKGEKICYHAPEHDNLHDDCVCALILVFEAIRKHIATEKTLSTAQLVSR